MKKSEVVHKAIDILQTEGWCQNAYEDEAGRHCMTGALAEALGFEMQKHTLGNKGQTIQEVIMERNYPVWVSLIKELGSVARSVSGAAETVAITDWNDEVAETVEDALLPMKQLAADLEERGE